MEKYSRAWFRQHRDHPRPPYRTAKERYGSYCDACARRTMVQHAWNQRKKRIAQTKKNR